MSDKQSDFETDDSVLIVAEQLRQAVSGGIGTYINGLLNGLSQITEDLRPSITVFATTMREGDDPLSNYSFPISSRHISPRLLLACWNQGLLAPRSSTSVVHATSLAIPPTSRPLSVMVHDLAWRHVSEAFPPRGRRWHEKALHRAERSRAHFVTPSLATAEDLVRARVVQSVDEVSVVEHGADHLPEPDEIATAILLDRLEVSGTFLLCVGTLEPRKNLRRLLVAYERARPKLTEPWPLIVVGKKGWLEGIEDIPSGVIVVEGVSAAVLSGLYQRALLLAYVPLFEGYGLPVTEAMFFGTPVVSSLVPSAGGASFLVDPYDVDSIASALVEVTGNPSRRASLIAAGKERIAPLTWRKSAEAHLKLWRDLAGTSS